MIYSRNTRFTRARTGSFSGRHHVVSIDTQRDHDGFTKLCYTAYGHGRTRVTGYLPASCQNNTTFDDAADVFSRRSLLFGSFSTSLRLIPHPPKSARDVRRPHFEFEHGGRLRENCTVRQRINFSLRNISASSTVKEFRDPTVRDERYYTYKPNEVERRFGFYHQNVFYDIKSRKKKKILD